MSKVKQIVKEEIEKETCFREENGVYIWNGVWYGRNVTFYSTEKMNQNKSIVVVHTNNYDNLHFLITFPTQEEKNKLFYAFSKNTKSGTCLVQEGGMSPGGIQSVLGLTDFGWVLKSVEQNEQRCYWNSKCDKEKMMKWLKKPEMKNFWKLKPGKKKVIDPVEDTTPMLITIIKK